MTGLEEGCTDTKIVIPATHEGLPVTEIGADAFAENKTIVEVSMPDSIKKVGNFAFIACSALTRVDFGSGLKEIGIQTFEATALEAVDFPEGLREIGAYAFEYCPLKEAVIPESVIRIGSMAFYDCESLTRLELREGLKTIGPFAFAYTSIEEVSIPDSVTELGSISFAYNSALKKARLGWGCTGISYGAFYNCTSLETVTITNLCSVHDSAFGNCEKLRQIYFGEDETMWETYCDVGTESNDNPVNGYGNLYFCEANLYFYSEEPNYDGAHWRYVDGVPTAWEEPIEAEAHLIFEENESGDAYIVTGLEESCTDTKIVIPAFHEGLPVTAIGRNAFCLHDQIEEVVLTTEIVEIGYGAFHTCPNLKTVNFPKRVKTIGDYAFYSTGLEEVHLPDSLRELGLGAFSLCAELKSVFIPRRVTFSSHAFFCCTALSEVTFEEGFDGLNLYAFAGCTSLRTIRLPESLTEVSAYAFSESGLTEIDIPENVKTVGLAAFAGCGSLGKVTFREGLHYIEAYAFQSAALTEVIIPESVYLIGVQAFAFNEPLKYVKLGTSLASCGFGAFAMCPSLEAVTIMNPLGNITDAAFGGCTSLKEVYFYGDEAAWESLLENWIGLESSEVEDNGFGNIYLVGAHICYYSEDPNADGDHWHFGEDNRPVLWE